ncbi:hypothetical protein BGZ57DRAFT_949359 [Hyaloscypha finlandica]|nr:hypothetical protein BGZ57DRAFT_949359 [Hyaloscypha finlandica]
MRDSLVARWGSPFSVALRHAHGTLQGCFAFSYLLAQPGASSWITSFLRLLCQTEPFISRRDYLDFVHYSSNIISKLINIMANECVEVGDANPDIAGVGILLSFGIQALLTIIISSVSLFLEFVTIKLEWETSQAAIVNKVKFWNRNEATWNKLLTTTKTLLQTNSDVQAVTGIALLISALAQMNTLAFYHLRLVYDTASFVAISTTAAIVCSLDPQTSSGIIRCCLVFLWFGIYLIYTGVFLGKLTSWDIATRGRCYNPDMAGGSFILVSWAETPGWAHGVFYVGITYAYMCLSVFAAGLITYRARAKRLQSISTFKEMQRKRGWKVTCPFMILFAAYFLYPVHTQSIISLRTANESLLTSGNTEQEWGFGQVSAILLLAPNLAGILVAVKDYRNWHERQENHSNEQHGLLETRGNGNRLRLRRGFTA